MFLKLCITIPSKMISPISFEVTHSSHIYAHKTNIRLFYVSIKSHSIWFYILDFPLTILLVFSLSLNIIYKT